MVRIQKLAVTHCWKVKKYFCRTSRYASARAWVDSTFTGVDPTFTWVDSTFPWVDPLRTTEPCNSAFLHLGRLNIFLGRLKVSWVDSTSTWVNPLRVSRESILNVIAFGSTLSVFGSTQVGRLNFILGRPSQYFQRTIFLSLWEAWGLGRLILSLGRPNYCSSMPFLQKCARCFLDVPGSTQSTLGSTQSTLCCNSRLDSSK